MSATTTAAPPTSAPTTDSSSSWYEDPAVIGGIAGVVVVLLIGVLCCCRKRSMARVRHEGWDLARGVFMNRLRTVDVTVQSILEDELGPRGLQKRIATADAKMPRGSPAAPPLVSLPVDALNLRRVICESAEVNQPIVETGLLVYQSITSALTAAGPLLCCPPQQHGTDESVGSDGNAAAASGEVAEFRSKELEGGAGRRVLCITSDTEYDARDAAWRVMQQMLARSFVHLVPKRDALARFVARRWIDQSVLALFLVLEKRGEISRAGQYASDGVLHLEMAVVRSNATADDSTPGGARGDDADDEALATLYIRTCGGVASVEALLQLRADVVIFLRALGRVVLEASVLGDAKVMLPLFRAGDVIDRRLAHEMYTRRCAAMTVCADAWLASAMKDVTDAVAAAKEPLLREASVFATARTFPRASEDDAEQAPAANVDVDAMTAFLNEYIDATIDQYSRAFRTKPVPENALTVSSCCEHCMPDFPVVRRIVAGERELLTHLMNLLESKGIAHFAVTAADREVTAKLLAPLKVDVLNRAYPASASRATSGPAADEFSDPDASADDPEPGEASSPSRDALRVFSLPLAAYEWVPATVPSQLAEEWREAPQAVPADVVRSATKEIEAIERSVADIITQGDPVSQRVRREVVGQLLESARPYLADIAKVVTVYKKLLRLARDACAAARQGVDGQLATILAEVGTLVRQVQTDPSFEQHRDWLPMKRLLRSMNAHKTKLVATRRGTVAAVRSDAGHGDGDDAEGEAPAPPPRVD